MLFVEFTKMKQSVVYDLRLKNIEENGKFSFMNCLSADDIIYYKGLLLSKSFDIMYGWSQAFLYIRGKQL
jgi:hypothetical protein